MAPTLTGGDMPTPECLQAEIDAEKEARTTAQTQHRAEMDKLWQRLEALEKVHHQGQGAVWAFAKIGMAVTAGFGFVGYLAVHGVPEFVKNAIK